jgi:hypothetical protein
VASLSGSTPAWRADGPGGSSGVIAVAGEALVDFVPAGRQGLFEAAPGGSPANVAIGLARLQVPVRLLARIADDLLGHRIHSHLTGNGVDLSFAVRAAEPTSLAIVAVGPDGVVEYDFRVDGTPTGSGATTSSLASWTARWSRCTPGRWRSRCRPAPRCCSGCWHGRGRP